MVTFPRFGDVAHVGHIELLTPRPEASLDFFTQIVGLHETARAGNSVYLLAWGDYERHTLNLTGHSTSGLGHLGLRVRDDETLQQLVAHLGAHGVAGEWTQDVGHGPAYRVATPDGHHVELYWQTERFRATPDVATAFKNAIAAVDAVLFVTPEYNRSIPGALKNAIDWASRPYGTNAFTRKPSAIIGTSPGKIGTTVAQQHLRSILAFCNSPLMNSIEAYIHFENGLISEDGTVSNEATKQFLQNYMAEFHRFIERVYTALPRPDQAGA